MSFQSLQQALASKTFEIVDVDNSTPSQIQIRGRIAPSAQDNWMLMVHRFAFWPTAAWASDISMAFVARRSDNKLVYFWRLIFQCQNDISQHYPEIARVIMTAPKSSKIEVTHFPLPGASPNRYAGKHGTRVGPSGKVLTGPDLLRRR